MTRTQVVLIFCWSIACAMSEADFWRPDEHDQDKYITVSSNYVFVGSALTVTCMLPEEDLLQGYDSDGINIYQFDAFENNERCFKPDDNKITLVDNRTTVLNLVASHLLQGVYSCHLQTQFTTEPCNEEIKFAETLGRVIVENPPENVTDVLCEAFNWNNYFICRWQLPKMLHPDAITVSLFISSSSLTNVPHYFKECTGVHELVYCNWTDNSLPAVEYNIAIQVNNTKKPTASTTKIISIDPAQNVRPAAVEHFKAWSSPDCFNFSWETSKTFPFKARILMLFGNSSKILADSITSKSFQACSFPPYFWREFCIELFPGTGYDGSWSERKCLYARTQMAAPSEAPVVTPGSYFPKTESCNKDNKRGITLFWKSPKESSWNGPLSGYKISFNNFVKTVHKKNFSTTIEIPCKEKSHIYISAFNPVGHSPSSHWFIESFQSKVPSDIRNSFAARVSDQNVSVSWHQQSPVYKPYIYWCKGSQRTKICEESLAWLKVGEIKLMKSLPLDASKAFSYLYGISVQFQENDDRKSSGIFWTSCLLHDKAEILPPDSFNVDASVEKINVIWVDQACSYKRNYKITGHKIKWCLKEASNSCKEHSVNYPEQNYAITHVEPGQVYNVTIKTFTAVKESDFLPVEQVILTVSGENGLHSSSIAYVLPMMCVILVAGLLGCTLYIQRRKKMLLLSFDKTEWDEFMTLPEQFFTQRSTPDLSQDNPVVEYEESESPTISKASQVFSPSSSSSSDSCSNTCDVDSGQKLLPEINLMKRKRPFEKIIDCIKPSTDSINLSDEKGSLQSIDVGSASSQDYMRVSELQNYIPLSLISAHKATDRQDRPMTGKIENTLSNNDNRLLHTDFELPQEQNKRFNESSFATSKDSDDCILSFKTNRQQNPAVILIGFGNVSDCAEKDRSDLNTIHSDIEKGFGLTSEMESKSYPDAHHRLSELPEKVNGHDSSISHNKQNKNEVCNSFQTNGIITDNKESLDSLESTKEDLDNGPTFSQMGQSNIPNGDSENMDYVKCTDPITMMSPHPANNVNRRDPLEYISSAAAELLPSTNVVV